MVEAFLLQLLAAALGALSSAMADWTHRRGRISLRLHSLWVSASIALIYLPILGWVTNIFLGPGLTGELVTAAAMGAIFFCCYQKLPRPRLTRGPQRHSSPPHPSDGAVPPVARSSG